jgi:hypothetical protein
VLAELPPIPDDEHVRVPKTDMVLAEMHVRGATRSHPQIDPAELHRVYPLIVQPTVKPEQDQTPLNTNDSVHFEEKIGFLERIIGTLENERDDLRRRLDKETEERREAQTKLTALLTHQPKEEPSPTAPQIETTAAASKGSLFEKLFGRGKAGS